MYLFHAYRELQSYKHPKAEKLTAVILISTKRVRDTVVRKDRGCETPDVETHPCICELSKHEKEDEIKEEAFSRDRWSPDLKRRK